MVRRLALSAVLLAAAATAGQASCIALLCYEDESCAEGAGAGGNGTTTASASTTSTDVSATASGTGGSGGGACEGSLTDPQNCGACNHDCSADTCEDGYCGVSSFDIVPNDTTAALGPLHVHDESTVLVAASDAACAAAGACVQRIAASFVGSSAEFVPIPDIYGMWGGGAGTKSYYSAQSTKWIAVCDQVSCSSYIEGQGHFNGPTPRAGALFVLDAGTPDLLRFEVDGAGFPMTLPALRYTVETFGEAGPHMMFAEPGTEHVVFTTYGAGGCLYRENASFMQSFLAQCDASLPGPGNGPVALALDPAGVPFVIGTLSGPVHWMPQMNGMLVPLGATNVRPPLAVDERFVYARSAQNDDKDGLSVIDRGRGNQVVKLLDAPILSVDATHPQFVFFTAGPPADPNAVYRWRKPPP